MIGVIAIYAGCFIFVMVLVKLSHPVNSSLETKQTESVTFIIPFKNETTRIHHLIQSFNRAKWQSNFEVIFVDDHSTDNTVELLLNDLDISFRILNLNTTFGKKAAIIYGVLNATNEHIHTLDADTAFEQDFLTNISCLPKADLTILPVHLSGNSLLQKLNKIEFQWLQTVTFALAKLKRPVLCNGANLSFSKTAFLNVLPQRTDFDKISGDDVYLLQAVQNVSGNIKYDSSPGLLICTPAPKRFKDLIKQRQRWIKKVINIPAFILTLLYICYHIIPFYSLFNLQDSTLWLLPILIKILLEWLFCRQYSLKQCIIVITHQVYYPIYGFFLLFSLPFKMKWK